MDVCPIVFEPRFKAKLWGGRKLESLLGKSLPAGELVGESWELVDLASDQSVVARGPAKGQTLTDLLHAWGPRLTGEAALADGRFPLLIKFLDARETLSVQVHPDEEAARSIGGGVQPKHETWYVVQAEEGACIYRGVRKGTTPEKFREALAEGRAEEHLVRVPARAGHCFYLPAGTIHALGAGVVVAEVQTPSDVTYRLYDWERVDPSLGRPRELHLKEGLACARFDAGPYAEERHEHVGSVWTTVTTLIRAPWFSMDRVRMVEGADQPIPLDRCFVIWMILEGRCGIRWAGCKEELAASKGDTVLLPAGLKGAHVTALGPSMWLEVSVPLASPFAGSDRVQLESRANPQAKAPQRYIPLNLPSPDQ